MNLFNIIKKTNLRGYNGRGSVIVCGVFATLLASVIIWCSQTTFRAMSEWILYPVNIFAALLLALPAIMSRKVWVYAVITVLIDALIVSNLMYCRTYFTAIPAGSYMLAGNLADFTASVWDSVRWADIVFPLLTMGTVAWAYLIRSDRPWFPRLPYLYVTVGVGLIAFIGILCRGGFYKDYDRMAQSCYYSTCGVPTYTIAGHLIYNAMNEGEKITPETALEIAEWQKEKNVLRPYTPLPDSIRPRRNMVIILLESFESWLLDAKVDGKSITPYLNSLIKDPTTLYAPNMLTQVGSGRSIDAQLLLGSGMLPMMNSVYSMKYPDRDYPSLMKAMKADRNSRNIIMTCDKPITWNQEVIARTMGYDTLLHRSSWKMDELVGNPAKLSDGSFMRQSVEKLRKNDLGLNDGRPYVLTFVTYSGHNPFKLPENLKDPNFRIENAGYPERMTDYVTMAHYTDSRLAALIEYLKSRPDYAETLIVITGDHEGLAGDRAEILKSAKAKGIVSPRQMTPFIVLNSPVGGHYDGILGQIDMYPTLLALLGLDSYYWKGMGESILSPRHTAVAVSTMTGEIAGDTTDISPRMLKHILKAQRISDLSIKQMKKTEEKR